MAVVEFGVSGFERATGLKKDKIIEGLTAMGAPCEENKTAGKIMVELTPNRPDWFAFEGLVRSLRSYYFGEAREYKAKKGGYAVCVDKSVGKIRPFTACAVVKGLVLDDERIANIVQVQEKLNATLGRWVKKFGMGLYPLDRIKFPLAYTTMKPDDIRYQPLNYPHEAGAREILEKHEKGQAYGKIIKDFERWPVYMDSGNEIMALVPIVNSEKTGKVEIETRDIFIEVTGTEEPAINAALNILVSMFADMGGQIYSVDVEYPDRKITTPDLSGKRMAVDFEKAGRILGIGMDKRKAGPLLQKMGYALHGSSVAVPPYRADIIGEIDIIEDIAIAYGYNNFEPSVPGFFTPGSTVRDLEAEHDIMRGMGFLEITTFILTNQDKVAGIGYPQEMIRIDNPSGEEFTCIRPTLIVDMLNTFAINKTKGLPQKFYEAGVVYENGVMKKKLCFGIVDKKLEFSEARGYLQTMMNGIGVDFELVKTENKVFGADEAGDIVVDGKVNGVFGRVSPEVLSRFRVDFEAFVCEIDV